MSNKFDLLCELVRTSFKLRYNNSVLGVGIFAKETHIWLTDHILNANDYTWKQGYNTLKIHFSNVAFYQGEFFIRCIFGFGNFHDNQYFDFFDSREQGLLFDYLGEKEKGGIMQMDHKWSYDR